MTSVRAFNNMLIVFFTVSITWYSSCFADNANNQIIRLATTTSTDNSGLLRELLPAAAMMAAWLSARSSRSTSSCTPGGRLIAMGANIKHTPGRYWDFWDHQIPFTEKSLSEGLRASGFFIDLCLSRFLPYTMSSGRQYPILCVKIYLALPFMWRIFGGQFLVVARK